MKEYILFQVKTFAATGGWSPRYLTVYPDLKKEGYSSTRPGVFVIESITPHVSSSRWRYSSIEWGTPIREESGIIFIKKRGNWIKIRELASFRDMSDTEIVAKLKYFSKGFTGFEIIPKTWIFNDFGHIAIKYFADKNHNYKKDGNESTVSDFIHAIQRDEAIDASRDASYLDTSLRPPRERSVLTSSHGCVHAYPKDIDALIAAHYLKKGNIFEVHDYYEDAPRTLKRKRHKYSPYEVHFFPFYSRLVVYGVTDCPLKS